MENDIMKITKKQIDSAIRKNKKEISAISKSLKRYKDKLSKKTDESLFLNQDIYNCTIEMIFYSVIDNLKDLKYFYDKNLTELQLCKKSYIVESITPRSKNMTVDSEWPTLKQANQRLEELKTCTKSMSKKKKNSYMLRLTKFEYGVRTVKKEIWI